MRPERPGSSQEQPAGSLLWACWPAEVRGCCIPHLLHFWKHHMKACNIKGARAFHRKKRFTAALVVKWGRASSVDLRRAYANRTSKTLLIWEGRAVASPGSFASVRKIRNLLFVENHASVSRPWHGSFPGDVAHFRANKTCCPKTCAMKGDFPLLWWAICLPTPQYSKRY